jgi:photosystem II stability/assembly factor-like uncharacterized protein
MNALFSNKWSSAFLSITLLGIVGAYAWSVDVEKTEKDPFKKFQPWESASFKWSYPDATWDVYEADEALELVRKHFEDLEEDGVPRYIGGDWRLEGPENIGGRINALQADPFNPDRIFAGSSAGGLFVTEDGGGSWNPSTDDFAWMAMGSIAFHPTQEGTVYLGTGDPQISSHPRLGNGVWKSTDAGENWTHLGLDSARIVSKLLVLEDAPEIVVAATMGNPAVNGPDRGLYRSTNSGSSWTQVLLPSDSAGVNDVAYDPDTGIMVAAGWNRLRNSTNSLVVGADSKLFRSDDQGETWDPVISPWEDEDRCRIGLSEHDGRFYALVVGVDMQLDNIYKSSDGGHTWFPIIPENNIPNNALGGFGWYFSKIRVNPWNPDDITILGVDVWNSTDGGISWSQMAPAWWEYSVHADKHDMQWLGPNSCILATDGGAYRTDDHGITWSDIEDLPNSQFYRVEVNPHYPGRYTGGAQDNGTTSGSYEATTEWNRDRGGDGFTPIFHPTDPNYRIATVQFAVFAYSLDPPTDIFYDWTTIADTDYDDRNGWDSPIMLHPANPDVLWTGTQRMWKMVGGPWGEWEAMSEDLTYNIEPALSYRVITSIAGSPFDENVVAAGTADGRVWITQDGGATWQEMDEGLPNRYVTDLYFDPFDENGIFCTVSGYRDYQYTPHILRAEIGGTWTAISGDLPEHPVNSIVALSNDTWAVASDAGVFATVNSGVNWERLGTMPWIPVYDLVVDNDQNRLVAGTFARSVQSFPTDSILAGTPPVIITCVGDIVINGIIDTNDILMLLSQYSCTANCSADIDGDGAVTISDVLALLAIFGQPC